MIETSCLNVVVYLPAHLNSLKYAEFSVLFRNICSILYLPSTSTRTATCSWKVQPLEAYLFVMFFNVEIRLNASCRYTSSPRSRRQEVSTERSGIHQPRKDIRVQRAHSSGLCSRLFNSCLLLIGPIICFGGGQLFNGDSVRPLEVCPLDHKLL